MVGGAYSTVRMTGKRYSIQHSPDDGRRFSTFRMVGGVSLVEDRVPTAGGKSSAESTSSINSCCGGAVGAYTAYIRALQRL
jgi:hypothetical protein